MASPSLYTLLSVLAISLLSLVGVLALAISREHLKKIVIYLVSLSAGTLLGGALFHLLPEAVEAAETDGRVWYAAAGGLILFFLLEKVVCWRHCHIPTSSAHPHPLGVMNLIGDGLHNFVDGMVIAGSFLVSAPLGLATSIAVVAHEVPQEMADFGVLIHAGYSRRRALFLNFTIALSALLGALVTLAVGSMLEGIAEVIVPITAGGFIYIATADLIPELKKDVAVRSSLLQLFFILAGLGLMLALKYFFAGH